VPPEIDACYDSAFFDKIEALTRPSAEAVAKLIQNRFHPASVIDIGCGSGIYLKAFAKFGITGFGVDGAAAAVDRLNKIPGLCHDLHHPLQLHREFDLAICWETAEHLLPEGAGPLVTTLASLSHTILFGAAQPGQGGDGHWNEQPISYWLLLFRQHGFEIDVCETGLLRTAMQNAEAPHWLPNNLLCLRRSPLSPAMLEEELAEIDRLSGWLSRGEIALLTAIIRGLQGPSPTIVEIGSWHGKSTVALARALRSRHNGGQVHAIDHHVGDPDLAAFLGQPWHDLTSWHVFQNSLRWAGVEPWVQPMVCDAQVAAMDWQHGNVDLIWIDGDHRYEAVRANFEGWEVHLADRALVSFHDTTNLAGPIRLVGELVETERLKPMIQVDSIFVGQTSSAEPQKKSGSPRPVGHPLVSIIIVTRNEGPFVQKTIDDLLAHTFYPHFELLVIDDASGDASCEFLQEEPYANDARLHYHRERSHTGYLALRRQAVDLAQGEVLQFLDAHSAFSDYWLWNLVTDLELHNYQALVGPVVANLVVEDWSMTSHACFGWQIDRELQKIWPGGWHEVGPNRRVNALTGHQLMVPKKVYHRVGGFIPCFQGHGGEDIEFSLRAARCGFDCHVVPASVIAHLFKQHFMNPVSWRDIFINQLITALVNFGENGYHNCLARMTSCPDRDQDLEKIDALRPEFAPYQEIVARDGLTGEELKARLPEVKD